MESHYSVGVSNRFSLFYEDDDNPGDAVELAAKDTREKLSVKEEKKPTVITAGGKSKDNNKDKHQATESQSGSKKTPTSEVTSKGGQAKGEKTRFSRNNEQDGRRRDGPQSNKDGTVNKTSRFGEQRRNRPPPREKDEVFQSGNVGSRDDKPANFREGRINSRGSGSNRGRGRGAFRGKREFDRRSGSDRSSIKAVEKREGSGGYNWGTVHDDLNAISPDEEWPNDDNENITNGINESATAEPTDGEKPAASQQPVSEQKTTEPVVEEMTLDEYKAKMVVNRSKPQYQERTVSENGSGDQWKDSVVFSRNEDEYIPSQREVIEKIKTSGRKVTPVEVSIHFKDPARRGRGRTAGGPTGFRGNQDRRSGGSRRDRAPNMTDPKDFPALNS